MGVAQEFSLHAVGTQGVDLRQTDLDGIETEDVGCQGVEARFFPRPDVTTGLRFEPGP